MVYLQWLSLLCFPLGVSILKRPLPVTQAMYCQARQLYLYLHFVVMLTLYYFFKLFFSILVLFIFSYNVKEILVFWIAYFFVFFPVILLFL